MYNEKDWAQLRTATLKSSTAQPREQFETGLLSLRQTTDTPSLKLMPGHSVTVILNPLYNPCLYAPGKKANIPAEEDPKNHLLKVLVYILTRSLLLLQILKHNPKPNTPNPEPPLLGVSRESRQTG